MNTRAFSLAALVAANVRLRREALGWSQEQLGAKSGLHRTYIGSIERVETNLTLATLQKLADALGCHARDLLVKEAGRR